MCVPTSFVNTTQNMNTGDTQYFKPQNTADQYGFMSSSSDRQESNYIQDNSQRGGGKITANNGIVIISTKPGDQNVLSSGSEKRERIRNEIGFQQYSMNKKNNGEFQVKISKPTNLKIQSPDAKVYINQLKNTKTWGAPFSGIMQENGKLYIEYNKGNSRIEIPNSNNLDLSIKMVNNKVVYNINGKQYDIPGNVSNTLTQKIGFYALKEGKNVDVNGTVDL